MFAPHTSTIGNATSPLCLFPVVAAFTFDPDANRVHVAFYAQDGSLAFERVLE